MNQPTTTDTLRALASAIPGTDWIALAWRNAATAARPELAAYLEPARALLVYRSTIASASGARRVVRWYAAAAGTAHHGGATPEAAALELRRVEPRATSGALSAEDTLDALRAKDTWLRDYVPIAGSAAAIALAGGGIAAAPERWTVDPALDYELTPVDGGAPAGATGEQ